MSPTLTALKALIKKDLVLYFSNRRALVMSIAAPIVIAAFFGAVFGSGGEKPTRVPIAVVDADGSALSKAVVASLRATRPSRCASWPSRRPSRWRRRARCARRSSCRPASARRRPRP